MTTYKIKFKDGEVKIIRADDKLILRLVNANRNDCIFDINNFLIYTDEIKYIEVVSGERSEP